MALFIVPVLTLNMCKNVSKKCNKDGDSRCTSVTHETPILKISVLSSYNSVLWRAYQGCINSF